MHEVKRCRIRFCAATIGTRQLPDLELAEQASGGDASAFRTIMQRNNGRLYRVARSVLKNDSDAEDAVQDAYLKAYAKLGEFRGDASSFHLADAHCPERSADAAAPGPPRPPRSQRPSSTRHNPRRS